MFICLRLQSLQRAWSRIIKVHMATAAATELKFLIPIPSNEQVPLWAKDVTVVA
jgi:hypothetical protein